jgi:hypothetical protein
VGGMSKKVKKDILQYETDTDLLVKQIRSIVPMEIINVMEKLLDNYPREHLYINLKSNSKHFYYKRKDLAIKDYFYNESIYHKKRFLIESDYYYHNFHAYGIEHFIQNHKDFLNKSNILFKKNMLKNMLVESINLTSISLLFQFIQQIPEFIKIIEGFKNNRENLNKFINKDKHFAPMNAQDIIMRNMCLVYNIKPFKYLKKLEIIFCNTVQILKEVETLQYLKYLRIKKCNIINSTGSVLCKSNSLVTFIFDSNYYFSTNPLVYNEDSAKGKLLIKLQLNKLKRLEIEVSNNIKGYEDIHTFHLRNPIKLEILGKCMIEKLKVGIHPEQLSIKDLNLRNLKKVDITNIQNSRYLFVSDKIEKISYLVDYKTEDTDQPMDISDDDDDETMVDIKPIKTFPIIDEKTNLEELVKTKQGIKEIKYENIKLNEMTIKLPIGKEFDGPFNINNEKVVLNFTVRDGFDNLIGEDNVRPNIINPQIKFDFGIKLNDLEIHFKEDNNIHYADMVEYILKQNLPQLRYFKLTSKIINILSMPTPIKTLIFKNYSNLKLLWIKKPLFYLNIINITSPETVIIEKFLDKINKEPKIQNNFGFALKKKLKTLKLISNTFNSPADKEIKIDNSFIKLKTLTLAHNLDSTRENYSKIEITNNHLKELNLINLNIYERILIQDLDSLESLTFYNVKRESDKAVIKIKINKAKLKYLAVDDIIFQMILLEEKNKPFENLTHIKLLDIASFKRFIIEYLLSKDENNDYFPKLSTCDSLVMKKNYLSKNDFKYFHYLYKIMFMGLEYNYKTTKLLFQNKKKLPFERSKESDYIVFGLLEYKFTHFPDITKIEKVYKFLHPSQYDLYFDYENKKSYIISLIERFFNDISTISIKQQQLEVQKLITESMTDGDFRYNNIKKIINTLESLYNSIISEKKNR